MTKETIQKIICDFKERKQRIETLTEIQHEKLENAVYNLQNAIQDEIQQNDTEFLGILLNNVISQAFSYFEIHAKKEEINNDSLLYENTKC